MDGRALFNIKTKQLCSLPLKNLLSFPTSSFKYSQTSKTRVCQAVLSRYLSQRYLHQCFVLLTAVKKTDTAADDKETDNKEDEEDDKVDEEGDVNEEQKHLDDNKAEEDKVEISEELATRIYDTITTKLLPQLRKCLTKKVLTSLCRD